MSLSDLNTTPHHERGITHHVVFNHPKRNALGNIIFERTGGTDEEPVMAPVLDRTEALFNDGKPVELILAGPDSDRVGKGQRVSFDIERRAAFEERPVTTAESVEANVARWCSAVLGWNNLPRGWVDKSGKDDPIAYSDENAKAMFAQTGMAWLGAQIDGVLMERNRFLPVSSASSEPTPPTSSKDQRPVSRRRSRKS